MLKIGLASGALILFCMGMSTHLSGDQHGNQFERRADSNIGGKGPFARQTAESAVIDSSQAPVAVGVSSVITSALYPPGLPKKSSPGHPGSNFAKRVVYFPTGANPFGFIPNEWTARPQMLPLTWDVRTVYAAERGQRVTILRVD
jgi:hypothetical protein